MCNDNKKRIFAGLDITNALFPTKGTCQGMRASLSYSLSSGAFSLQRAIVFSLTGARLTFGLASVEYLAYYILFVFYDCHKENKPILVTLEDIGAVELEN